MSAKESSSSSSSSHSSPSSSPETAKKAQKTPSSSPELPPRPQKTPKKAPKSPPRSPETPKKAPKTPPSSPELPPRPPKKAPKTPPSSPELPPRPQKTPKKAPKSPPSSPEAPKKTPKTPMSSPETPMKTPKSPPTSSETPKKAPKTPPSSPEVPKTSRSPTPKKVIQPPTNLLEDDKVTTAKPKAAPKKLADNKMFTSSLQVLLQQKQNTELVKSIEYKEKLDRGDIDEEDEPEGERREGRRGSEDGGLDREEKERTKKEEPKEKDDEEETAKNAKPAKAKKKGEESEVSKTKDDKKKTRKESKEEKTADRVDRDAEKSKKVPEKERKRSDATITEEKEEEKKQPEKEVEEKKGKKEEKEGNEKREEERKKRERPPESEKKKSKEEETKETNAVKEGEKVKKEEGVEETRKKEGKKDEKKDEKVHGHLYLKRKRTFNPWKEYYFVLDGLLLTYYRSQQDYERLHSMKGSLDLSLVEEVQPRKAGLLKTHHPFRLSRRNLTSIHLAADTKNEQERWIGVLQTAVGPRRLSTHSSDKTLNSGAAAASRESKSSTLPARVKDLNSCSSSITEEGDEEEKKAVEKKEEEEEEEEPELIKPKKVAKVPIGMPLVKVDLGQIKLKKVEKTEVEEDVEEGKTADVPSSPPSTREPPKQERPTKEASPAEMFGVVLKKTKNKEKEEEKEAPGETPGSRDGSVSPGTTAKRPSKQPVIPLNNKKLLVVPEAKESKSPKVSPGTQKRTTPERRKSPSPSLPISKSVQALTKSAEEVRAIDTVEAKSKSDGVKVCHAHTSEVKYSNVEILDVEEVVEEEETAKTAMGEDKEKKDKTEVVEESKEETQETMKNEKMEEEQKPKEEKVERKVPPVMPLKVDEDDKVAKDEKKEEVSAAVKETQKKETPDERMLEEDSINNNNIQQVEAVAENQSEGTEAPDPDSPPDTSNVPAPLTPPASPASSTTSTDSETVPEAPRDSKGQEKAMESNSPEQEQEVLSDAPRGRTSTNESTASSSVDGGDKKAGKFKRLKSKLKAGASVKEKKEDPALQKEPKEKKRRGSSTFSSLLQGKKTKEGTKKAAEEDSQLSQPADKGTPRVAPQDDTPSSQSPPTEAKALPAHVVSAVDVQVTPPSGPQPTEEKPKTDVDAFLASLPTGDDGLVMIRTTPTCSEARDSIYSHTSTGSRDEPPPCIPEKTYMRVPSPNHDVPQNNRPVTNLDLVALEDDNEDEDANRQKVDGILTEEQIEELLNAKENSEKRKRSKSRSQMYAQPDVVKGTLTTSTLTEDWAVKRPSYTSFSSVDSDEPLPTTNFLSFDRRSSSSGSIKGLSRTDGGELSSFSHSDSGESLSPEVESPAEPVRRAPRATAAITAKNRVSLTSPEFTVMEEEGLSSPETPKAKAPRDNDGEGEGAGKTQQDDDKDESQVEAEDDDFFPVVGGDIQMRQPSSLNIPSGELRTSGIVGLKEYLKTQEEDFSDVKSGISRLGHSAAVEKLKQATSEQ